MIRLQKLLAAAGLGSRRTIEQWIRDGRITIAGRVAQLGDRASAADDLRLDGRKLELNSAQPSARELLLYHKPVGEVTTRSDPQGRPTVFERLPAPRSGRWITVGRLDVNTSGLLLFTTDGELAHRLMHPSSEIEREYLVRVRGRPQPGVIRQLLSGVELEDGTARFDRVTQEMSEGEAPEGINTTFRVVLHEGRNREVRRLWQAVGLEVSRLLRVRYGPIELPRDLRPGAARVADMSMIERLTAAAGKRVPPAWKAVAPDPKGTAAGQAAAPDPKVGTAAGQAMAPDQRAGTAVGQAGPLGQKVGAAAAAQAVAPDQRVGTAVGQAVVPGQSAGAAAGQVGPLGQRAGTAVGRAGAPSQKVEVGAAASGQVGPLRQKAGAAVGLAGAAHRKVRAPGPAVAPEPKAASAGQPVAAGAARGSWPDSARASPQPGAVAARSAVGEQPGPVDRRTGGGRLSGNPASRAAKSGAPTSRGMTQPGPAGKRGWKEPERPWEAAERRRSTGRERSGAGGPRRSMRKSGPRK